MLRFSRLSIRAKLIGAFSLLVAFVVGLGLFGLNGLRTMHGLMAEVQDNWLPGVRWAGSLKAGFGDVRDAVLRHVLAANEPAMRQAEAQLEALRLGATAGGVVT